MDPPDEARGIMYAHICIMERLGWLLNRVTRKGKVLKCKPGRRAFEKRVVALIRPILKRLMPKVYEMYEPHVDDALPPDAFEDLHTEDAEELGSGNNGDDDDDGGNASGDHKDDEGCGEYIDESDLDTKKPTASQKKQTKGGKKPSRHLPGH